MTDKQLMLQEMKRLDSPAKKVRKTGEPILTASLAECIKAAKKEGKK